MAEIVGRQFGGRRLGLEFKAENFWLGAHWKRDVYQARHGPGDNRALPCIRQRLHVWICLLPMLPLHFAGLERRA